MSINSRRRPLAFFASMRAVLGFAFAGIAALGCSVGQAQVIATPPANPAPNVNAPSATVPPATNSSLTNSSATTAPTDVRNGYAENLQPLVRRKAGANAKPYAPIKKQDEPANVPEIEMFVGESRVFPAPNVGRIAVGNGQIMTAAALDKKEVIVFANAAGTSSLFVWNEDGRYQRIRINIITADTARVAREIALFLGGIPNAKTSVVGDKVIVEGDNLSDADMAKIDQLEKRYAQLVNFTNRIGWEQMVMMDVKVVEFPKSELREVGLKWRAVGGSTLAATWLPIRAGNPPRGTQYTLNIPSDQGGLPLTTADTTNGVPLPSSLNILGGLNLGLSAQLNLLEQEGRATILAEPQLSARNGAKASFLAGGEFPYSVASVSGVTVVFKPYGIKLDISPKVDRNGVIRATIQAEVSSIDASVSSPAGPALLTRKTDTEFNVRSGETIILSGLLQRNTSTDIDKVPLLGDIPVLGALFRSKRFQNKETELVVFVTPSVVDSKSPGLVDRVGRATQRLEQQLGRPPYLSDPLQPNMPAAEFNRAPEKVTVPAASGRPATKPFDGAGLDFGNQ
ncbi:MAG: pilus assembly protein N-terminal domain-containing protein [Pseudomonadota bacterium]